MPPVQSHSSEIDEERLENIPVSAPSRRTFQGDLNLGVPITMLIMITVFIQVWLTALQQMPADNYKVVIRADKTPVRQHERQYNTPTIDEVAIVIVSEEFNSRDKILYRRNGDVQLASETHFS
ncbi:helitron_like_N domain-containing protein [Caerostris darwini]|uniref:Helitron_like_N domain-containing protein n=1 Tax=Caerostris darwini TaxID=1538125 RepID=A0AAV4UWG0_9ARAC|nr:helitron_like_N domain-containing protein [Caerostris darwini]